MIRTVLAVVLAWCVLVPMSTPIWAGGWATISFVDPPAELVVQEETVLEFEVLAHNNPSTPVTAMETSFLFEHEDTGYFIAVDGELTDDPEIYAIAIEIPREGAWTVKAMIHNYRPDGPILWNATDPLEAVTLADA